MTNQEAFDIAVAGLAAQNFEASVEAPRSKCVFRGAGGKKCAIGHLIPDERYISKFEDTSLDTVLRASGITLEYNFARTLQRAHDTASSPIIVNKDTMKDNLRRVAKMFDLVLPEVLR